MKEPQFKAWHKNKKCWISICPQTGYGLDLDNGQIYYNGLNITERIDLFQFTGLRDNKGKKIYEGNIVLYDRNIHKDIDTAKFKVVWAKDRYVLQEIEHKYYIDDVNWELVEVIGHICENSESLERRSNMIRRGK